MVLKTRFHAAALLLSAWLAAPAAADVWTVDSQASTLGFEVAQGGSTTSGVFTDWQAQISFDPDAPESAKITARISPASATTGNPQFDGTLPGKDWFNVSGFPQAEFTASGATRVEGNSYRAAGTLTIKGISHPVALDFTLEIDGDTAKATGTATVDRLAYEIGTAVAADTVGDAVKVTLDLNATR
ncbi:MAG: YceI family protein [Roseibium sp.]